jgi:hypothetical protein
VTVLQYSAVRPSAAQAQPNPAAVAPYMFWLMFRNVASDGLVFEDPVHPGVLSQPGCVLASPSWENYATQVEQDYVYNWTRDAAVVAIELAAGPLAVNQPLIDYVQFAQTCQNSGGDFDRASFLINGTPRAWTDQSDGPALQTLAILAMYGQLDAPTQAVADTLIAANLNFLQGTYQGQTYNLWEEEYGASFFARSVQLACFEAITANAVGLPVPGWLATAITWLQDTLQTHWNGQYYQSMGVTRATPTTVTPTIRWVTIPGRCPPPPSPSCTTGWPSRPAPERCRWTTCRPASSPRSGSARRPHRPRPAQRWKTPATRCCRRSSSTATISSSASSSTPTTATRKASATCPGVTPHSSPRPAPKTLSEACRPSCRVVPGNANIAARRKRPDHEEDHSGYGAAQPGRRALFPRTVRRAGSRRQVTGSADDGAAPVITQLTGSPREELNRSLSRPGALVVTAPVIDGGCAEVFMNVTVGVSGAVTQTFSAAVIDGSVVIPPALRNHAQVDIENSRVTEGFTVLDAEKRVILYV